MNFHAKKRTITAVTIFYLAFSLLLIVMRIIALSHLVDPNTGFFFKNSPWVNIFSIAYALATILFITCILLFGLRFYKKEETKTEEESSKEQPEAIVIQAEEHNEDQQIIDVAPVKAGNPKSESTVSSPWISPRSLMAISSIETIESVHLEYYDSCSSSMVNSPEPRNYDNASDASDPNYY